ncbi:MAG: ABC transporter permease [Deltaproteobacteria bacterium]|nr:ABC transporter permease [Deltaproteobacteria bacterium]
MSAAIAMSVTLAVAASNAAPVILSTTTSVGDTGLLDVLGPLFEQRTGRRLKPIAVGTGQALALGRRGEADVLIAHAPKLENEFVAAGFGVDRQLVMANEFWIVGPKADPAAVRGKGPVEAFAAISKKGAVFVSRGDRSGTHVLEQDLWKRVGAMPERGAAYVETGSGMGKTLAIASQRAAYTLTDSSTFIAHVKHLALDVLVLGDPLLLNVYHVIRVNPARHKAVNAEGARAFADFVTSSEVQGIIAGFGADKFGKPLFKNAGADAGAGAGAGAEIGDPGATGFALIWEGAAKAFALIFSGDREVWRIIALTVKVALLATLFAVLAGIPVGIALARGRGRMNGLVRAVLRAGMAVPPVVAGLVIGVLFWRTGPLGGADLLYTPGAMVLAQAMLAFPIAATLATTAIDAVPGALARQIVALGATRAQLFATLVFEARRALIVAVFAALARALTEVGASIIVGGNILGETRILTTATVMEMGRGDFDVAIALGIVLLVFALIVSFVAALLSPKREHA